MITTFILQEKKDAILIHLRCTHTHTHTHTYTCVYIFVHVYTLLQSRWW